MDIRRSVDDVSFENDPLNRNEYIAAMVHFYRGELGRANDWRLRLDTTTNWAVVSALGVLSFAYGTDTHSHASIVLGMLFTMHFLMLESRRFRFFDVWRHRVRMVEENFYGPLLTRELHSNQKVWGQLVATDLLHPTFKMTYMQAFRIRLMRNYWSLFVILLLAWPIKLKMHPAPGLEHANLFERMAIGPIDWYYPFAVMVIIYGFLLYVMFFVKRVKRPGLDDWSEDNPRGKLWDY
jgi:uncharacterized membrane protein